MTMMHGQQLPFGSSQMVRKVIRNGSGNYPSQQSCDMPGNEAGFLVTLSQQKCDLQLVPWAHAGPYLQDHT